MYEFNDKDIPITTIINDEQLLDFALTYIADKNTDDYIHPVAYEIVITYIINELDSQGIDYTDELIHEKVEQLLLDHILSKLANRGLIDVDFETLTYKLKDN